jgi:hypothetical protein
MEVKEYKQNVFGYHEFVANCHMAITQSLLQGSKDYAKKIALQLYIFAKGNMKDRDTKEKLLNDLKELQKKDFEEIYVQTIYALYDAGYSGVQEHNVNSFFKNIMKKKRIEMNKV